MFRLRTVAGPLLMVFSRDRGAVLASPPSIPATPFANWELFYSWILIYLLITNTITHREAVLRLPPGVPALLVQDVAARVQDWAERGFGFAGWGLAGPGGLVPEFRRAGYPRCASSCRSRWSSSSRMRPHMGKWTRWLFYFVPVTAVATIVGSSRARRPRRRCRRGHLVGGAVQAQGPRTPCRRCGRRGRRGRWCHRSRRRASIRRVKTRHRPTGPTGGRRGSRSPTTTRPRDRVQELDRLLRSPLPQHLHRGVV